MGKAGKLASSQGEKIELKEYSYLSLLARVKKALDSAVEIAVPVDDIRRYEDQPREFFDEKHINGLRDSIDAGGQTTSGMIREKPGKTRYELIDGECRWRGIQRIPEDRRPLYKAKLIDAEDDVVQYLISGIANFNRRGHTALEVLKTIDRLVGFKLPMREIATLLGISEGWAHQMHGLKNLRPDVQALLSPSLPKDQQLPIAAAVQISKIEPKFQLGLAERVMRKDISLSRLRGEVVRVAQKAGSLIRLREVSPTHQWASFGNKIEVITKTASDAKSIIEKKEVNKNVNLRPKETRELLQKIEEARRTLGNIESLIRQKRSTA